MEALIAQLKGCLPDCIGWELNCCVLLVQQCALMLACGVM